MPGSTREAPGPDPVAEVPASLDNGQATPTPGDDPMSTTTDRAAPTALPPLVDGERLDRATFHERYEAMPDNTRAELIGGIVSMIPALGMEHGSADGFAIYWLNHYAGYTPGVQCFVNTSVFFEDYGEHQPDCVLRIRPECGGKTRDQKPYYAGGPELVVETSHSSLAKDVGPKLADYERAEVLEYLVVSSQPPMVRWHVLKEGRLVIIPPDADGLHRSAVYPGLWLDPAALLAGNIPRLRETVDRGVATPEHAEFVAKLARVGGLGEG